MIKVDIYKGSRTANKSEGMMNCTGIEDFGIWIVGMENRNSENKYSFGITRGHNSGDIRRNKGMDKAKILIADVDNTDVEMGVFHDKLKKAGISHCMFSSYNHKVEGKGIRFKVIVEMENEYSHMEGEYDLKCQNEKLADILDVEIDTVSNTFSQLFFFNTHKECVENYCWYDGGTLKNAEVLKVVKDSAGVVSDINPSKPIAVRIGEVLSGEILHANLRSLSYGWAKDGMPLNTNLSICKAILDNSAAKEHRHEEWIARGLEIDNLVKKLYEDKRKFDLDEINKFEKKEPMMPKAPGDLGRLVDMAYATMTWPNENTAMVAAMGAISGVVSRKYNSVVTKRMALNIFMTIVGDTGSGKNGIFDFINNLVINAQADGTQPGFESFVKSVNYTGAKGFYRDYELGRCGVNVILEAGQGGQSRSGDPFSKMSAILQAFDTGAKNQRTGKHTYSKGEDDIQSHIGVCPTMIMESNPESMGKAYYNSATMNSGFAPRQSFFSINMTGDEEMVMNPLEWPDFWPDVVKKMKRLGEECSAIQDLDDYETIDIDASPEIKAEVKEYGEYYRKVQAKYRDSDQIRSVMANRVNVKAIRWGCLASVWNTPEGEKVELKRAEWDWAKEMAEYEFERVQGILGKMMGDKSLDKASLVVYENMRLMLNGSIGNKASQIGEEMRERKWIPYGPLKRACGRNGIISGFDRDATRGSDFRCGLDVVLDYMRKRKAIKEVSDADINASKIAGKNSEIYEITIGMNSFIDSCEQD